MITDSIAHVLESAVQYMALIVALLLYQWIKEVFFLSHLTHTPRLSSRSVRVFKSRNTRILICDEFFILYQWMRQLRQRHNLTQEEMAEKLGVDPRTIQRWEKGARPQPRHYSMFQELERAFRSDNSTLPSKIPQARRRLPRLLNVLIRRRLPRLLRSRDLLSTSYHMIRAVIWLGTFCFLFSFPYREGETIDQQVIRETISFLLFCIQALLGMAAYDYLFPNERQLAAPARGRATKWFIVLFDLIVTVGPLVLLTLHFRLHII
jgi:transcriptional regulator with XRE-family HTH domain